MKATVVVHLQGGPEQALRCFESLAMLPPEPEHEVIVVDDASVGLEDLLARLEGDVNVISLEQPLRLREVGRARRRARPGERCS